MEEHEVVIVGAGPAGLHCANLLSKEGKEVLVLEKAESCRTKICAGGLTRWAWKSGFVPEEFLEHYAFEVAVSSANNRVVFHSNDPFIITYNREEFGKYQKDLTEDHGGEIRLNSKVVDVTFTDKVVLVRLEGEGGGLHPIKYNKLIGAGGPVSIVRKKLDLPFRQTPTCQFKSIKPHYPLEWGIDLVKFGFVGWWNFPHNQYSEFGFANMRDMSPFHNSFGKEDFKEFFDQRGMTLDGGSFKTAPIQSSYNGHKFKNGSVYLIGDAGGFANPIYGEGITPCKVSAEGVANDILGKPYKLFSENVLNRRWANHWMCLDLGRSGVEDVITIFKQFRKRTLLYKLLGGDTHQRLMWNFLVGGANFLADCGIDLAKTGTFRSMLDTALGKERS